MTALSQESGEWIVVKVVVCFFSFLAFIYVAGSLHADWLMMLIAIGGVALMTSREISESWQAALTIFVILMLVVGSYTLGAHCDYTGTLCIL